MAMGNVHAGFFLFFSICSFLFSYNIQCTQPPLLPFHHRDVLPLPAFPERLCGRHLCKTSQEGDSEQKTIDCVYELLGPLVAATTGETFPSALRSLAVEIHEWQQHGQTPCCPLRPLSTAHGDDDDDRRQRGDIREQELDRSPAAVPGLVPRCLKVVQTQQHALLRREGGEHAGLQARGVAVRCRPWLEQGEAIGERDEQRVARLYGFAGDDVARFGGRA